MNPYTTYEGSYPVIQSRSKSEHFNNRSASIYEAETFDPLLSKTDKFILRHINVDTEEVREEIVSTSSYFRNRFNVGEYREGSLTVFKY